MSIDARHTMLLADCMTYKVGRRAAPCPFWLGSAAPHAQQVAGNTCMHNLPADSTLLLHAF